ncbi:Golgi apparatus membrane protein TVP23 [Mycena floridula]|nr:Golgi apparatus membrane protein TVP23 [Mycena floridula]
MSVSTPLLENTIEADDPLPPTTNSSQNARTPVVLTPTNHSSQQMASSLPDAESGISGILRQSAHPIGLLCCYAFRTAAITTYILCGWFTTNYVVSVVVVVALLACDFWTVKNVSGRLLVGLRFWNQVDSDGQSFWVFEARDPKRPPHPVDARMFWMAIYVFPLLWGALFIVSLLKLSLSFIPIVILALVFNVTLVIGFTYADRDAKQRWANQVVGGAWNLGGIGGLGGQLLTGAVQKGVGRLFG